MIHELLSEGEENAISAKALAEAAGITTRGISRIIEKERRQGSPICATCKGSKPGYYLAKNRAEMENFCGRLYHRAGEIFKTRRACLATLDSLPDEMADK